MLGENGDLVSSRKATASALSRVSEVDDVVVSEIRPGCPGQLSTTNETCRWPYCSIRCAGICAVMVAGVLYNVDVLKLLPRQKL